MHLFLIEQTGTMMLCSMRRFSGVGPLRRSAQVRLQDSKPNTALAPPGPALNPKKHMTLETFKVNLYPGNRDPVLKTIMEPGSAKRLLKSFDALELESLSPKYSTQGIVTLWNMEFMHQSQRAYASSDTDELFGPHMYCYSEDPSVNRIVSHIVSHAAKLNDKPLAASLYCMYHLKFDIRGEQSQTLVNELLKRKSRLALPALARLCVILRKESLYGNLVLAEFAPLLRSYVGSMSTDQQIQLVTVAIRAAHVVTTKRAFNEYVVHLKKLFDGGRIRFTIGTLCPIMSFLIERKRTLVATTTLTEVAGKILRRAGNMLIPHVPSMDDAEIVGILKILEFEHDPAPLIEVLSSRLSKIVEKAGENASIHLVTRMRPSSFEEKVKLEDFLRNKLKNLVPSCQFFPTLSKILQKSLHPSYDPEVFNAFWSLYEQVLGPVLAGGGDEDWHEWPEDSDEPEDVNFDTSGPIVNFLRIAVKYIRVCAQLNRTYRHRKFEATASKMVVEILRDYEDGWCFITTQDYAGCIAFLIATGHPNVTVKPSFLQHFRARHFILLDFGVRLSGGYFNRDTEAALEQQFPQILKSHLGATEYLQLARMTLPTQDQVFQQSMRMIEAIPWNSVRFAMEYLQLIKTTAYYSERSFQRISKFICQTGNDISWNCATEFVLASYMCGAAHLDDRALRIVANVIKKSPCKGEPSHVIRSMLGLCYYKYLSQDLVDEIFSVKYIHQVDKHIMAEPLGSKAAANLRKNMMQLNRAVCIDMPEARVQWFHGKYCHEKARIEGPPKWSSEHFQVYRALSNIIGPLCLTKNAYSPYFHAIDILVYTDGKGNPIPVRCKEEAVGKLAVIVHHLSSYTSGEERRLKGFHKLERRQLEALGYRVIEIDPLVWHRFRSSKNGAEQDYLRECIFQ